MRVPLDWCERQFRAMGRPDAPGLAVQVFAAYQGAALLTCAQRDPGLLERESRRIAAWVGSLLQRSCSVQPPLPSAVPSPVRGPSG
jgi:TetR/AcrR family transcriptional repressor of nem operon